MHSLFALFLSFLSFFGVTHDNDSCELQSELKKANKELAQVETKIHQLQERLAIQQIKVIQKEFDKSKEKLRSSDFASEEKTHSLFHEERLLLAEIIEKVPSCAHDAQHVLDQILSLITLLSDNL